MVFDQQNLMIVFELSWVCSNQSGIDLFDTVNLAVAAHILHHSDKDFCQNIRIIAGTVVIKVPYLQMFCNGIQFVIL